MLHIMTKRASSQECELGSMYQRPSTDCATLTGSHGTKPTQTPRHTQGERDDDAPCSRTGRLDAVEAAVRPTLLCGVNVIPPNPSQLPCAQRHPTSKRVRRGCRRPATANATLTESDKLTPPASETHYEATTIRTARHWPKDRRADRWIGVEGPQTDPP